MSDEEIGYRHKRKNIESENEEEEENNEEEEEDPINKRRKKRKLGKISYDIENDKNSSSGDKNSNNEDKNSNHEEEVKKDNTEENADIVLNLDENKNISNENENANETNNNNQDIKKTEAEYIAQIEGLENEINLEKTINSKLKESVNPEEIIKLQNDLNDKNMMLEKLKSTNKKQKYAISLVSRKLIKENKKRLKLKSPEAQLIKTNESTERSKKNGNKLDAINIVLKVKEKELINATIKMNTLKSENEGLKKLLYESEDYSNGKNMEDKLKEMNDKIEKSTNEKNVLMKQLKLHKKCLEEQKIYREKYESLKEELKEIKNNIQNVKLETKSLINSNQKKAINISLNTNKNNRYKLTTGSSPNIHLNRNKRNISNTLGNKKTIILPLIRSQTISQNESILTDNFTKKVKEYLEDEDEYNALISKISNIEKSRELIEIKHKNELKQFNSQIISLDEQYKLLNCDSKGSNCNIRVLRYKLNTIKGDNKHQSKKLNELKKELNSKTNLSKDKDYEISLLIGQINSLRNLANYGNVEIPKDEISSYISKIKQKKGKVIKGNKNEKREENDIENKSESKSENKNEIENENNKINENKNKDKIEESIQVDFPDSDDYNEQEGYEEGNEVAKNSDKYKENNKKK